MIEYEEAAWEVHQVLTQLGLPYAIIGGIAVQEWGDPRFTKDIDLTILAPLEDLEGTVQTILSHFATRIDDPLDLALRSRMLLVRARNGYPIDMSFGIPGYEEEVMRRAVNYKLSSEKEVRLCSAEDLIIHKAVAGRPQDIRDIEGVIFRQQHELDDKYIRHWLSIFSDILETSELLERFERPWRKLQEIRQ
jgi:hypothetical protein